MSKVLVLVPFALDESQIAHREAQTRSVSLRPDVTFHFKPVKAGPTTVASPHDWMLPDIALFAAGLTA